MTLQRFLAIIRAQWWVIVLVALLGAGVALAAVEFRNRSLEPVFEAVAPISVLRLAEESAENYARRLETVEAEALSTVATRLTDDRFKVRSDPAVGAVQFVVTASTSNDALDDVTELRDLYLESRPLETAESQLAPVLDALAVEIADVAAQLAGLQGTSPDPVLEAERTALQNQLQGAAQEVVGLRAQLLDAGLSESERATLATELTNAEAVLRAIGTLLAELSPSAVTPSDPDSRLSALVLSQRLSNLESQYVATALSRFEGEGEGLVGEPFVVDQSSAPFSPIQAIIAGLAAGALLAGVALVATDRIREPVRTVDDIPGMALVTVNRRSRRSAGPVVWYQAAGGGPRRTQIQVLRTRLDRSIGHGGVVLVSGVKAASRDVRNTAIDLAAAVAATGRSVMFIDTQMGSGPEDSSWDAAGASLADMLRSQDGRPADRSYIKRLLWDRSEVGSNLILVSPGSLEQDPIDALAGLTFAMVVEEARDVVDVVVLATGDIQDPAAEAVAGRASMAVLVSQKDRTRRSDLTETAALLEQLGVVLIAVALLVNRSLGKPAIKLPKPPAKRRSGKPAPAAETEGP